MESSRRLSESKQSAAVVSRARRASEQFRALNRVLGLIRPLLSSTAEYEELEELGKSTEKGFNALVLLEGVAQDDALRPLESAVQQLEQKLVALDGQVPMGWFREHFDPSQASSVALADYATILGRVTEPDPTRLDRIQFLLTRLVSFFISPEDDSPARRRQLLAEALPPSSLAANTRETVVAFCHDAIRRLGTFSRLKELMDSGFFVDVRGYKLSLRQQLLDPDVMAAVIDLNGATSDTLDRLATAEQQEQGKALEEHLAEVDQRIKAIFKQLRVDESEKTKAFEAWIERSKGDRAAGRRPGAREFMALHANRREDKRLLLGAITLILFLVMLFRLPANDKLRTYSEAECRNLSPLIVSGATPAASPNIFVGTIDKSRWALMDLPSRTEAAVALAKKVQERGWTAATIMLEEQVVIQIEQGNVLVVQ